jgi:hypothetical protein
MVSFLRLHVEPSRRLGVGFLGSLRWLRCACACPLVACSPDSSVVHRLTLVMYSAFLLFAMSSLVCGEGRLLVPAFVFCVACMSSLPCLCKFVVCRLSLACAQVSFVLGQTQTRMLRFTSALQVRRSA